MTWAKSIDLATGRPVLDPSKQTGASRGSVKGICPSLEGGVSPSSPPAYSPRTHLFYSSTNNLCMDYASARASHLRGTPFVGINSPYSAGPGGNLGTFMAWDAATGKKVWENKETYPNWSGALVTAGDVAFYGTLDGWFKSVDARTGQGVVEVQGRLRGGRQPDHLPRARTASSTWRSMPASAATGCCSAATSARMTRRTCARPLTTSRTSPRHTSQGGIIWIFGL